MKIYTFPPSPNSLKIFIAIEILGLNVEQQVINIIKGEQKEAAFSKINPNNKIPALVDDDLNLWESNAILLYLTNKSNNNNLYSNNIKVQADINRWLFWQTSNWEPACGIFVYENFAKKFFANDGPDPKELKKGRDKFNPLAVMLNDHLTTKEFLVGTSISIADIAIGAWLTYWEEGRIPLKDYPNVNSWHQRVSSNAGWQRALKKSQEFMSSIG